MTTPPASQTNPLDPVFSGVPVVYPQTGMVNPTWSKWFVDLREKVNVINASVAALSGGTLKPVIEVHAGTNVTVDNTDIQNPIVSASGGGGGGIPSGTSFPGAPTMYELFFRTDSAILFFYNGTYWLSINEYTLPPTIASSSLSWSNNTQQYWSPIRSDFQIYVTKLIATMWPTSVNNASNYWTVNLGVRLTNAVGPVMGSVSTSGGTPSTTGLQVISTINSIPPSGYTFFYLMSVSTGSPGQLFCFPEVTYRLIGV